MEVVRRFDLWLFFFWSFEMHVEAIGRTRKMYRTTSMTCITQCSVPRVLGANSVISLCCGCLASDTNWPHGVPRRLTKGWQWRSGVMCRHGELVDGMWVAWLFCTSLSVLPLILPGFLLHWSVQNAPDTNAIFCGRQSNSPIAHGKSDRNKGQKLCYFQHKWSVPEFLTASNRKIKITWDRNSPKTPGMQPICNIPMWPGVIHSAQMRNYLPRMAVSWENGIWHGTCLAFIIIVSAFNYWHFNRF